MALSSDDVERLYREHARAVLAFLVRRALLPEVAVDLMAETFAQAYRDRRGCRAGDDAERVAWIFGIARHCLTGYVRRGAAERRALRRFGVERRTTSSTTASRSLLVCISMVWRATNGRTIKVVPTR